MYNVMPFENTICNTSSTAPTASSPRATNSASTWPDATVICAPPCASTARGLSILDTDPLRWR